MTDKELKRLSRGELLQILLDQSIEIDHLQRKLAATKEALAARNLQIEQAGTLAEAAMQLNKVFADADAAAALYLENIRRMETEWIEKTGGKPADDTADAKPETDGEPKPDNETTPAPQDASDLDAVIESSIPEPKPQKESKQKRKKSRHKR